MFDGEAFALQIVETVKAYVERAVTPLVARIAELEAREPLRGEKGEAGEPGAPGRDGIDGANGQDGRDGIDGKDGLPGEPGAPGRDGIDGKDGTGIVETLIDRSGALVLTMSDGRTQAPGIVVGRDGKDGRDGIDGKDGLPGERGEPGFSLDALDVAQSEDGRTVVLSFDRGDVRESYELSFPVPIDRGIYHAAESYAAGDVVTWGGSLWIARRATTEKPSEGEDWRLAVRRGRDGKNGEPGPQGPDGRPGRDLTSSTF